MEIRTIRGEADFIQLMLEIDAELQGENVPIPARELRALGLAAQKLGVSLMGHPHKLNPPPGGYEPEDIPARLFKWMRDRYGDRLKMDFSRGAGPASRSRRRLARQAAARFWACAADLRA